LIGICQEIETTAFSGDFSMVMKLLVC